MDRFIGFGLLLYHELGMVLYVLVRVALIRPRIYYMQDIYNTSVKGQRFRREVFKHWE